MEICYPLCIGPTCDLYRYRKYPENRERNLDQGPLRYRSIFPCGIPLCPRSYPGILFSYEAYRRTKISTLHPLRSEYPRYRYITLDDTRDDVPRVLYTLCMYMRSIELFYPLERLIFLILTSAFCISIDRDSRSVYPIDGGDEEEEIRAIFDLLTIPISLHPHQSANYADHRDTWDTPCSI